VDVGFGDSSRLPLRLVEGDGQFGVGQEYCLTRDAGRWTLWRKEEYDGWYAEYAFQIDPLELSDFQCACDYYQFTPGTYFVEGRICSRATPHGRITLTDDKLIVTRYGQRDEMPVQDEQAFLAALQEHMGIRLRSMDDPHYHPT
jgi:N-hydroxyarylamine O-acetyltransferase